MKKRTKIELVLFFVIAVFYLCSLAYGTIKNDTPDISTVNTAISEVSIDNSDTVAIGDSTKAIEISEDDVFTDKENVALYIHTFGKLPSNYITKKEAKELGWESEKENLPEVCPGMSIGGDKFQNREGILPKKDGRQYYECDIDYDPEKGSRNGKRLIYSNDGMIYYTDDHYETFEQLYESDINDSQ